MITNKDLDRDSGIAEEEKDLVQRSQRGDGKAFDVLVCQNGPKILSSIQQYVKDELTSEDISQETWLQSWLKINQFRHTSLFSTWVYRIAVNKCRMYLRKISRGTFPIHLFDPIDDEDELAETNPCLWAKPCQLQKILLAELKGQLDEAISLLTPLRQEVLVSRAFNEMSHAEIATRLGTSVGAVRSNLCWARKDLRTILADNGVLSSAGN